MGIFVDFRGAFDYLEWAVILDRLVSLGCPEVALWRSYFQDRSACVVGSSGSVRRGVARGCPQGSICGPYIWNLMMDALVRTLAASFKVCAYADDLLILVEGQARTDLELRAERAMSIVEEWGRGVGVAVSREKTVMMLLRGILSRKPSVSSGGVFLQYVTRVKYLGVILSERMGFLYHLTHIREKLTLLAGSIRRVLRNDWGLSRRAARVIYEGLFVACATFGAPVWCAALRYIKGREDLLRCQRAALLACLPVCRTVSTEALQVLLGVPPLDLEVQRRVVAYKIRRGLPLGIGDWLSPSEFASIDRAQVRSALDGHMVNRWQDRWEACEKGRVTFSFIREVTFVREHPLFCFGLGLGFFLTGHGPFGEFLHKRGLAESAVCSCGAEVESIGHVLLDCPLYEDIRDVARLGVVRVGDDVDFGGVLGDDRSLFALRDFSREYLIRRRGRGDG